MARRVLGLVPLTRGVRATLKSPEVASMLARQASRAADRCNALCSPELRGKGARYDSEVVQRGYTAGGVVFPSGKRDGYYAGIDNRRNNTLKKGCNA